MTRDEWTQTIIAQDDDCDYSESGWVAWLINGVAYLGSYSHCSCYDTWDSIINKDGIPQSEWAGTLDELRDMATNKMDPNIPTRVMDPKDYDYDHLMEVYKQILEAYKG